MILRFSVRHLIVSDLLRWTPQGRVGASQTFLMRPSGFAGLKSPVARGPRTPGRLNKKASLGLARSARQSEANLDQSRIELPVASRTLPRTDYSQEWSEEAPILTIFPKHQRLILSHLRHASCGNPGLFCRGYRGATPFVMCKTPELTWD